MNNVEGQIVIDAPVEKVWEVLADFSEVYRWAPSVTKSYSTSESSNGPEASRHCEVAGFGGVDETITQWDDGRGFTYSFSGVGPVSGGTSSFSVKRQGDMTLVQTNVDYSLRFGLIGSLMNALIIRRKIRQSLVLGLQGLKHHVKTGELIGTDFRPVVSA